MSEYVIRIVTNIASPRNRLIKNRGAVNYSNRLVPSVQISRYASSRRLILNPCIASVSLIDVRSGIRIDIVVSTLTDLSISRTGVVPIRIVNRPLR